MSQFDIFVDSCDLWPFYPQREIRWIWVSRRFSLLNVCGGYNCDSTSIWRPLDCLSKVIKVTVTL